MLLERKMKRMPKKKRTKKETNIEELCKIVKIIHQNDQEI